MLVYRGPGIELRNLLGADPADLVRTFRLEKEDLLLGEPIRLEFAVALNGAGTWREEVILNSVTRERRNHFLFLLMRHADGTWVRDPLGAGYGAMHGTGGYPAVVRPGQPVSQWFGVQRWCLLTRPGTYDLYCFQLEREHGEYDYCTRTLDATPASWTLEPGTVNPLLKQIPPDVLEVAKRHFDAGRTGDFAHLTLRVREGTGDERSRMVRSWTEEAIRGPDIAPPRERSPNDRFSALCDALIYAKQDDFLPVVERWLGYPPEVTTLAGDGLHVICREGLALRASPAAMALLEKPGVSRAWLTIILAHPTHRPALMPWVIRHVLHEDPDVRRGFVLTLQSWSGQVFVPDRDGKKAEPPWTLEECERAQEAAKRWWEKHEAEFTADPTRGQGGVGP
jgi:hypothetical protein